MIDWSKIRTIDDIFKQSDEELYDEAPSVDELPLYINPNLTEQEYEDAFFWKDYTRGIMLVTGMPGQGKGMFVHMLAYKQRKYFGKTVISDTRPRKVFGPYIPFNQDMLVEQLDRMTEVATGVIKDYDPENPPEVRPHVTSDGQWISSRGDVFMRNSVQLLDEFGSRYMYIREPQSPIQRTLLREFTVWRHLRTIILGIGTEKSDFSPRCYPKVTCEVRIERIMANRLVFGAKLYPLRYISSVGELEISGRPVKLPLDGELPRIGTGICEELGELAWKDLYNTDNAVALEPPKSMRRKPQ